MDNKYPYNETNELLNIEYFYKDSQHVSLTTFKNSYYERTFGVQWGTKTFFNDSNFFYSFRFGLFYGYREEYKACRDDDAVCIERYCDGEEYCKPVVLPTTWRRTSYTATPTIGYKLYDNIESEIGLFGDAVVIGVRFKL